MRKVTENRQRHRKLEWYCFALQKEARKRPGSSPLQCFVPLGQRVHPKPERLAHPSWCCMEGPCHLLWGLRYSKLGACLNRGPLTLAWKQKPEYRLSLKQGRLMSPAQTVRTLNLVRMCSRPILT